MRIHLSRFILLMFDIPPESDTTNQKRKDESAVINATCPSRPDTFDHFRDPSEARQQ